MQKNLTAYKEITQGLTVLEMKTSMSPITMLNDNIFPILTVRDGHYLESICGKSNLGAAGGFLGSGRFIVLSHEKTFTTEEDTLPGENIFRENVLTWLGNGFTKKKIGFTAANSEKLTANGLSAHLKEWGKQKNLTFENISESTLADYDVAVVGNPWKQLSVMEIDSLLRFVKNGGGLLVLGDYKEWEHKNDFASADELPINKLGEQLGFKIESGWLDHRYEISEDIPELGKLKELIMISVEGKTEEEIRALLAVDNDKVYAVEGANVALHFTNDLWPTVKAPKRVIESMEALYEKEHEFVGKIAEPYAPGKFWYITNVATRAFMYMSSDHCGMSVGGAVHFIRQLAGDDDWATASPGWGFGHEAGHGMVNRVCGGLFQPDATGESWCNVINIYAHKELGLYELARNQGSSYASNFYGDNRKFAHLNGTDYDLLPDEDRVFDILLATTAVFVKLPMLIIDYYGWDGMAKLFQTAAADTKNGNKLTTSDERNEYMIVNISKSYNVDFTPVFEHWRFPVTERIKEQLKDFPKEEILMNIYRTTKNFDKYTEYSNSALKTN